MGIWIKRVRKVFPRGSENSRVSGLLPRAVTPLLATLLSGMVGQLSEVQEPALLENLEKER